MWYFSAAWGPLSFNILCTDGIMLLSPRYNTNVYHSWFQVWLLNVQPPPGYLLNNLWAFFALRPHSGTALFEFQWPFAVGFVFCRYFYGLMPIVIDSFYKPSSNRYGYYHLLDDVIEGPFFGVLIYVLYNNPFTTCLLLSPCICIYLDFCWVFPWCCSGPSLGGRLKCSDVDMA